jgi:hypothetical protein
LSLQRSVEAFDLEWGRGRTLALSRSPRPSCAKPVLKESLMDGANVPQHGLLRQMEFRGNNLGAASSQSFLINQVMLTHPIDKDLAVPTR